MVNRPEPTLRRLLIAIAIPLFAFLSLAAWSVSSPVAASPDDDFHLASIWCGLGEREGLCEDPGDGSYARLIPTPLTTATCFAFHSDESGACWNPAESGMTLVKRANADGLYPPVFYGTMSVFASTDVQASVMAMRIFNSLFAVGLLTGVFWALPRRLRPALVISVVATGIPLGYFVLSSTNPSSWAVLSAATVWITLYAAFQTEGRRRLVLAGLATLGAVIGAGARADSAVYAAFAVIVVLLLAARPSRGQPIPYAFAAAIVAISIAFYLSAWQGNAIVSGLDSDTPPLSGSQIVSNALNIPLLWTGALGGWALGWIDTNLPGIVWVLSTMVFAGALFVGVHRAGHRRLLAIGGALLALWAVPFVLLYQSHAVVGDLVQPRYLLPLMVLALGVASARADAERVWRGPRLLLAGVALTIAFAVSLHTNIQRYTTGTDQLHIDPGAGAEWWWAGAPAPIVAWIGGTLAFAGMLSLFALLLPKAEPEPSYISPSPGSLDSTTSGDEADAPGVDRAVDRSTEAVA